MDTARARPELGMVAESDKLGGAQTGASGATVLLGLFRAIRKYWVIVVACVTLSAGLALVYSRTLPRVFQAAAMLELDPSRFDR